MMIVCPIPFNPTDCLEILNAALGTCEQDVPHWGSAEGY
jgi:hypothetical protein